MGRYWLMDRHGADGPTVLVETDGTLRITDVIRFGPAVTKLEDQQKIWDEVSGKVAPTLKPVQAEGKVAESGIDVHADLRRSDDEDNQAKRTRSRRTAEGANTVDGKTKRTGGRGRG